MEVKLVQHGVSSCKGRLCAGLSLCVLLPNGICKDVAAAQAGLFNAEVEAVLRMLGQQVFGFLMFRDLLQLLWLPTSSFIFQCLQPYLILIFLRILGFYSNVEGSRTSLQSDRNDSGEMAGVMIRKKKWKEMGCGQEWCVPSGRGMPPPLSRGMWGQRRYFQ